MRLLALDQASKITGYAVFIEGKLETFGKIDAGEGEIGNRLHLVRENIAQLITDYDIDFVAFEDIQLQQNVQNNVQTFKVLAEVFGVIYELVTALKIENTAVLAGTWKSTLGIKGRNRAEQKRNAQEYVLETYGVKAIQDVCDAICIGSHILKKPATISSKNNAADGFDWSD